MSFDVVLDVSHDQHSLLLKESALQGVGNADFFRNRFFTRAPRAVEQISSRLCALSTLFAFFPGQTRV